MKVTARQSQCCWEALSRTQEQEEEEQAVSIIKGELAKAQKSDSWLELSEAGATLDQAKGA